jgi:hypothetical protein
VGLLWKALDHRKAEVLQFKQSYMLSGAAGTLRNALVDGCSTGDVLKVLQTVSGDDGVVGCASRSISACGANRISSVKDLRSRWPAVRRSVQIKASLHDAAEPGLMSTILAGLVSSLKVSEWASLKVGQSPKTARTLDVHLAAIDSAVATGKLLDVATLLEELLKFARVGHVADDFAQAVKARVLAEQTVQLMHAHAAALATLSEGSVATSAGE